MAEPRLGGPKLSGKPAPHVTGAKLGGKLSPYVPRGAQYDYNPPSVFARYKVLSALFVILLVSLFGYWIFIVRQPRAAAASSLPPSNAARPGAARPDAARPPQRVPQGDPVYIEPLAPK
jgi:hypothetical protein